MTDKVYHSFGRTYRSRAAATAIQYAAGSEGWVVPSNQRLMEDPEGDLATGSLNAFAESHSSSSLDVTIDTGEALVGGAYLARDTTTTVTLSSSTTGQTVYVGWADSQTDTVIIGKSGAFGSNDRKIPIWTFDTDGSGVTSATDERNRDNYRIENENIEALRNLGDSVFNGYPFQNSDLANSTVSIGGTSVGLGGTLGSTDYHDFANHEQGDYTSDGRLYWDKSVGLYIRSSNAPNSTTNARAVWSSENVSAGSNIGISTDTEDRPTLAVSPQGSSSGLDSDTVDGKHASELGVWTEDGNSPVNTSESDGAYQYTMDSTWDEVLVHFVYNKTSANGRSVDLLVNGDTGSNYNSRAADGTTRSGDSFGHSAFGVVAGNGYASGELLITGRWNGNASWSNHSHGDNLNATWAQHGENSNVSSPLNTFTITNSSGESADIKLNVFGRDL